LPTKSLSRLHRLQGGWTFAPIGKIDERRGAAEQRRAPDLLGSGGDQRRAVGLGPLMMQMHVRIDAARHHDVPGRVDHALGGVGLQRAGRGERRDGLAGDRDVAVDDALRRHDLAASNDEIEH